MIIVVLLEIDSHLVGYYLQRHDISVTRFDNESFVRVILFVDRADRSSNEGVSKASIETI